MVSTVARVGVTGMMAVIIDCNIEAVNKYFLSIARISEIKNVSVQTKTDQTYNLNQLGVSSQNT